MVGLTKSNIAARVEERNMSFVPRVRFVALVDLLLCCVGIMRILAVG